MTIAMNSPEMLPPWLAFPEIPRFSIGWRMGAGEDYYGQFTEWFQALSAIEQERFIEKFPAPAQWRYFLRWFQANEFSDERGPTALPRGWILASPDEANAHSNEATCLAALGVKKSRAVAFYALIEIEEILFEVDAEPIKYYLVEPKTGAGPHSGASVCDAFLSIAEFASEWRNRRRARHEQAQN